MDAQTRVLVGADESKDCARVPARRSGDACYGEGLRAVGQDAGILPKCGTMLGVALKAKIHCAAIVLVCRCRYTSFSTARDRLLLRLAGCQTRTAPMRSAPLSQAHSIMYGSPTSSSSPSESVMVSSSEATRSLGSIARMQSEA